jgi:hypothetical protein
MADRRPRCYVVDVDGTPVVVRGTRPPSDTDRAALAELVHQVQKIQEERPMHNNTCRRCQAPIVWAITRRGRPMPVDAQPALPGNDKAILAVWREPDGRLRCRVLAKDEPTAGREHLGVPHWATCPHADAFRNRTGQ